MVVGPSPHTGQEICSQAPAATRLQSRPCSWLISSSSPADSPKEARLSAHWVSVTLPQRAQGKSLRSSEPRLRGWCSERQPPCAAVMRSHETTRSRQSFFSPRGSSHLLSEAQTSCHWRLCVPLPGWVRRPRRAWGQHEGPGKLHFSHNSRKGRASEVRGRGTRKRRAGE